MRKYFVALFVMFSSFFLVSNFAGAAPTKVYNLDYGLNEFSNRISFSALTYDMYFDAEISASYYNGTGSSAMRWNEFTTGNARIYPNDGTKHPYSNTAYLVDAYNNRTYTYSTTYCDDMTNYKSIYPNKYLGWSSSYNPYFTMEIGAMISCPWSSSDSGVYNAILTS
jgi:hypothetical protein